MNPFHRARRTACVVVPLLFATGFVLSVASCGGGGGGPGPTGPGQGLVLEMFSQDSTDNVALNTTLEFVFSEPVSPSSVSPASLQIREGPSFGRTVPGTFRIEGSVVCFDPTIPNLCDLSDAGFQPGRTYRVTVSGHPEEFCLRNMSGQPLEHTHTYHFITRTESEDDLFLDLAPNDNPGVAQCSPADGSAAVKVQSGNAVTFTFTENLDPCSVSDLTFQLDMVERGDMATFAPGAPSGNLSGFDPVLDQAPLDPDTWGANGTTVSPMQRIPTRIVLDQSLTSTVVRIEPLFGRFPENALLVMRVSGDVLDFSGQRLDPCTVSFTTENLPAQQDGYVLENAGETPYSETLSTADVNTSRSPSKAQGYLLISGDGDNGSQMIEPQHPDTGPGCDVPRDLNDGVPDHFAPVADVILDTGATLNTCPNAVDGSTAVVYEFASFHIPTGVTVSVVGANPVIFLVNGPVAIDSGGTLDVSGGDGANGNGTTTSSGSWPSGVAGGKGRCGGGDGGDSQDPLESQSGPWPIAIPFPNDPLSYGEDGFEGFGSDNFPGHGWGGGQGNAAAWHGGLPSPVGPYEATSCGAGGGGGGHADVGGTGDAYVAPSGNGPLSATARGEGGKPYASGPTAARMLKPTAGSGGGAGGYQAFPSYTSTSAYAGTMATGGGGGAGGGFVDISSSFDIVVHGTIDASGGRGGNGNNSYFCDTGSSGGGGGGSGGGIRLLTSSSIDIGGGTLTAAGGRGGSGGSGPTCPQGTAGLRNDGGDGSAGRIVMEDADGVIAGQGSAVVEPAEGDPGFYRGQFDAKRFVGGGRVTAAQTELFLVGAFDPQFVHPVQSYGGTQDFLAAIPLAAADAPGTPQIMIEAQGYEMQADGTPDLASATGWRTVGFFEVGAGPSQPKWNALQLPPAWRPSDNTQPFGIDGLNGSEYVQLRITFVMGPAATITDGGPYIDRWTIRFTHDH